MDKLRALSVFASVVERGSFAAAADHLGLSRTAASRLVMDLEAELGATLLNRTTRRVSLTQVGETYAGHARRILEQVDEADREASAQTSNPRGRLRISAPMSFGVRHVAPRLKAYMTAYPDMQLDLVLNDRLVDLADEGFDLAIRIGRLADSALIARKLASCRIVLCAAPAYLRENGEPSSLSDIAKHVTLGYPYWAGQVAWTFAAPDGRDVRVPVKNQVWSNNGDALLNAAISGLGIILQPDFIVYEALRQGKLVELFEDFRSPEVGIHALYASRAFMPVRIRSFIEFLSDSFARDTPWTLHR
jgi:DNA-binding transcriptional LysR family regulator